MHSNFRTLMFSLGSIGLAVACSSARAQNFNIDFDFIGSGTGAGIPSPAYGAALAQPGNWQAVQLPPGIPIGLFDIAGTRTIATVTVQSGALNSSQFGSLSTDGNRLFADGFSRSGSISLTFASLENGTYAVATVATPPSSRAMRVSVAPSSGGVQLVEGPNSDTFAVGFTHALHLSAVTAGQMVVTIADPAAVNSSARVQGIQLKRCMSDVNGDGAIDFFDYLDFVDAYSAHGPSADFNHDSVIDFFDYLDFVDALSAGC